MENRSGKMPMRPGGAGGMGGGARHMAGFTGPKVRAKDTRTTLKRLWKYLRRRSGMLFTVFGFVLLATLFTLVGPILIGRGIDAMTGGKGGVDFRSLAAIALALTCTYFLSALMTWFQTYIMIGIAQDTVWDLRSDLFSKIQTLPLRFFDGRPHGELMSRLTNDVENINNTLTQHTTQLFSSVITVLGALSMMLYLSPLLTVISLATIPVGIAITAWIARNTRKHFSAQQTVLGELNGFIEETVSGQKVVKAFCHEQESLRSFAAGNDRLKDAGIKAQVYSGIIPPMMNAINNMSFALVAWAGGWMAINGLITIGIIASFLNYSKQFARPINEIANLFNMIQSALAGAERVFEIMDEKAEFEGNEDAPSLGDAAGKVTFDNVCFGYSKEVPVLKNVSMTAEPGQTIALVGPTGAGKTTIVNLLTRFYDVDSGSIRINGTDIREVQKDSLRRALGIVLQDTYLFSDTVRENIRYGRLDASDAEVEAAARLANAEHFILRLPEGYDTVLSEDGGNLSQGQRQLLTIARAILANPAILILDEATSSVDTRTELHIQEAMLSLMKGRTSFVIAHRLSTIREADLILVIHNGEIIEKGSHKALLAAKGFYYELYTSQLRY